VPDRADIIWIDCNPQVGREMRDMHPMLVLSPKAFNARTSLVIGLPMTSSTSNDGNPFALDISRGETQRSFILCHQPKYFDWRHRHASPHPWKRVTDRQLADACEGLNDIISLHGA
jgi:mRNA interferase MazF